MNLVRLTVGSSNPVRAAGDWATKSFLQVTVSKILRSLCGR